MFKIESYVTPWLLGYLDQYVKLRPEDLQLSLWGGDAALYNLDLRLEVLQKAMQLPIIFKSGHIHELKLHVPWTKLGWEPMVITINTVECIVKVRDTAYTDTSSSASGSTSGRGSSSRRKIKRQAAEDLPPGYLQSILNRVMNNVTFIVNNLIIKFVEDDIVLSVNVKSAECYSCDGSWNRAFVDLTPQELVLRRMINFSDLTICLDKSNADGHIENYQEPMLYRCFITCRLHMCYDSVNAKLPSQTKMNVMCDRMDGLVSDTQLPMFLRLIELFVALYYGYLDIPTDTHHEKEDKDTSALQDSGLSLKDEESELSEATDEGQGWGAWMWSMVPQILPEDEDMEYGPHTGVVEQPHVLSLGFYIQQATLTFKVTEKSREKSRRGQKLTFHPIMVLKAQGVGVEILLQGLTFFNAQCGIGHLSLSSMGPCICGQPADSSPQESLILKCGAESRDGELAYDWGSLFDPASEQNQGSIAHYVVEREEHMQRYTEQYGQQRFGAFWMDYLSTLVLPHTPHSGSQSSDTDSGEAAPFQQEMSTCRFLFGPSQIQVTSSSYHRIYKVLCYAWNSHYEPYKNRKPSRDTGERVQVTEAQLAELEEEIPTCTYHVTLLRPSILLHPASHPVCCIPTKTYSTHSRRSRSKTPPAGPSREEEVLELSVSAQRFDLQLLSPMYPGRLVKLVSNIAGPSSNLLYHCHSHTQLKVFSLQVGLQRPPRKGVTWRPVILVPPCSTAFYFRTLLLPHLWTNSHLAMWERSYEVPQVSVTLSKASLMAATQLLATWTQGIPSTPSPYNQALLTDLFPQPGEEATHLCVLELSASGLEARSCYTPLVQAYTGSVSSIQISLYMPGLGQSLAATVPILYGPVDSNSVSDRILFQHQPVSTVVNEAECLAFTVQKPHHTSITEAPAVLVVTVGGLAGCMDPGLLCWFSYMPRRQVAKLPPSSHATPAATVDVPLAQATSPLQTGSSHMSVRSNSSHTQPTSSRLFSHSHTASRTPSHRDGSVSTEGATGHGQLTAMDGVAKMLISAFPLLRMMHVQVGVKSSCVFVPKTCVGAREASGDIPGHVQAAWWSGVVGEAVVVCLPDINIHSVSNTPMDILQDIPITTLHGALISEKLPWTVEMSEWSVFTLHPDRATHPLMSGLGVSSTLGATVQYNPPTSDTIHSIALCLHLDLKPPVISLSHTQVGVLRRVAGVTAELGLSGWHLIERCMTDLLPGKTAVPPTDPAHSTTHTAQQVEHSAARYATQHEPSLTGGTPEMEAVTTTDVSDEASHLTSPRHAPHLRETGSDSVAKLSVWLQCVLPKLTVQLLTGHGSAQSGEVSAVVEDLALSCDLQRVYCKVKATMGSVTVHNFTLSGGERTKAADCPVLVSTSRELPHLDIHSCKVWTSTNTAATSQPSLQESFSSDKMQRFFSLTYTRALCHNVHRKMKRLNVELTSTLDKEEIGGITAGGGEGSQGFYFNDFVSEVCVKMEPLDVVLHLPTVQQVLAVWKVGAEKAEQSHSDSLHFSSRHSLHKPDSKEQSSLVSASYTLPLIHVDVGAVRLFLPVSSATADSATFASATSDSGSEESATQQRQNLASTLLHDLVLLQWAGLHVQPHADNPLPRYPLDPELLSMAMHSGMMQQTGSCVEDRQFQLTLRGLAVSSGVWGEVVATQKEKELHSEQGSSGVQIPALDWNNYLGHRPLVEEVELIPMVTAFDLCLVVAPPIAYTAMETKQYVVVSGLSAEFNVVSDLDLHLSAQQISLLTKLTSSVMVLSARKVKGRRHGEGTPAPVLPCHDSGVASEASTVPHSGSYRSQSVRARHSPANILLTAGRISLTLYSHVRLKTETPLIPPYPPPFSQPPPWSPSYPSKGQRSGAASTGADNFASLTRGMPQGDSDGEADEGDCVAFSFIQPARPSEGKEQIMAAGTLCACPVVYVYVTQPHTVLNTWSADHRLELSCYDILVKGVQRDYLFPVTEQRVMPDHADFSVFWVETRAGQPDSKTGIPPSLLTLQVSSLLTPPAGVKVKVERPVKVSLCQDMVDQVMDFVQQLTADTPLHPTDANTGSPDASPEANHADCRYSSDTPVGLTWFPGAVSAVNHMGLHTEQVILSFDYRDCSAASGLLVATESIEVEVEQLHGAGQSSSHGGSEIKVQGSMCWKDMMVKTVYNKMHRTLAGPVTLEADILLRWPGQGQATPPQLVMGVQSSLVLLCLGQEHLMCLSHLLSGLRTKADTASRAKTKRQSPAADRRLSVADTTQLVAVSPTRDDLRSGAFVYLHNGEGGSDWPAPGYAVFSVGEEGSDIDSTLTWAYTEPRIITTISTLPVPFGLHAVHTPDFTPTVSCTLQHWDECVEEFVTYATFELSEDSGTSVQLPPVRMVSVSSLAVARVWRVVLSKPSPAPVVSMPLSTYTCSNTTSNSQGVLLATQLAGTMCLDSAALPCLVPILQMSFSVPMVQLHLYNHLQYNSSEVGGALAGYRLSSPSPQDQQWGVVSVSNISVVASYITPPLARSSIQVNCEGGFEVMDYNSLHLQSVIDPVDVSAALRVHHHPQQVEMQSEINGGLVQCHVGRSVLHTINTSLLAWTQFGEDKDKGALVFAHLIVCNNTQQTLRFGQAGTDENVVLPSGHMFPYSWRSSTVPQQLHMCLDHPTWRWCAPLDVGGEGHAVRVVRARDQRYTLIIQLSTLSPVHKQVKVSGQFVVCSHLSQALEVRFQLQEGVEGAPLSLVEAGKSPPSLVAEHGEVTGFTVRLAGHRLPWSHTLQLSGNAMHANQLLKVLLPDGTSFIHVWCRIFCQSFSETRQKLIVLSPLYVLRSHLPLPLHVRLHTPRTNKQQLLEVKGQGQEYQLHCAGGDVTHQLSFQLGPELGESSPPVVLSTGLVDQVDQTPLMDINIQSLCQDTSPCLANDWPYTALQPLSECGDRQWSDVEQAGVDINVQLSQYLPGCNTLLVDISPWCLITNLTSLPLRLLSEQHSWALPHGCTVAPPALQELRLGCEAEGQLWEGPVIPLSEDEVEQHRYSPHLGKVLYLDGQVQLQLLLPPAKAGGLMQVIPLVVISAVKHGMRIVSIAERLRLSNTSDKLLQCRMMAAPQTSSKIQPSNFNPSTITFAADKGKRRGDTVHPLLSWQLLQEEGAVSSGQSLDLLLYLSFRIEDQSPWSVPVRVMSSPDGCRSTVGVEVEEEGACTSLCVSSVVEGGVTYLVVSLDMGPNCWIHNLCPFSLQYGQALDRTSFSGLTVQEEIEVVEAVPMVTSGRSSLYTMPKVNATFPQLDPGAMPCLHVRAMLPDRLSDWSAGIALDDGDTFLHMKGVPNIKVKIERSAMVHHVTFSVLNKAEVSAKEVRSRIEGRNRTEEAPSAQLEEEEECGTSAVVRQPALQRGETWVPVTVGVLLEGVVVTLQDDTTHSKVITQLMQVEMKRVLVTCYPVGGTLSSLCAAVSVGYLQVDNPLAQQGLHDFPVVLQPQAPPPPPKLLLHSQQHLTEVGAEVKADSFIHVQMVLSRDPSLPAVCFLDSVEASVRPLSVFFEDSYFFCLYREALALVPHHLGSPGRDREAKSAEVPAGVWGVAHVHQQPLRIRHLCVQPVSLLLSVHASVRLFLATDHAPLTLGRFERHNLFTGTQQLAYVMAMHYITAAIFRAGMVVGSLDLLGSPTGLVRSVGVGLSDLVRLPYQGLTRSPAAFVTGVFGGVSSLMRNVTAGMVNSVTNFASSVSRNMDRLSLDSGHQQRQEESRRQRPTGLSSGLQQGLTGFGLSLLGAVAGLVDQPLQSVVKRNSAASAGSTASSIVAGMGKGLVGIITKPIGGAAELVSQTGQGILQGSGLRQPMGSRCSIADIQRTHLPTSWLKYSMKLLSESSLLLAVSATQQDVEDDVSDVVVLLTGDMVVVVNQQEDAQQQAFALSQLQCHSPAPAILVLSITPTACHSVAQMLKPSSEDRVAAFINSTSNLHQAVELAQWTPSHTPPPVSPPSGSPPPVPASHSMEPEAVVCYEFRLDPHWCQLFVALFDMATNRQGGRGFAL